MASYTTSSAGTGFPTLLEIHVVKSLPQGVQLVDAISFHRISHWNVTEAVDSLFSILAFTRTAEEIM